MFLTQPPCRKADIWYDDDIFSSSDHLGEDYTTHAGLENANRLTIGDIFKDLAQHLQWYVNRTSVQVASRPSIGIIILDSIFDISPCVDEAPEIPAWPKADGNEVFTLAQSFVIEQQGPSISADGVDIQPSSIDASFATEFPIMADWFENRGERKPDLDEIERMVKKMKAHSSAEEEAKKAAAEETKKREREKLQVKMRKLIAKTSTETKARCYDEYHGHREVGFPWHREEEGIPVALIPEDFGGFLHAFRSMKGGDAKASMA